MVLPERDEVPTARSPASRSTTDRPREAASNAAPAPVTPPPTTTRSCVPVVAAVMASRRVDGESVAVIGLPRCGRTLPVPASDAITHRGESSARVPRRPDGFQELHLVGEAVVVEGATRRVGLDRGLR